MSLFYLSYLYHFWVVPVRKRLCLCWIVFRQTLTFPMWNFKRCLFPCFIYLYTLVLEKTVVLVLFLQSVYILLATCGLVFLLSASINYNSSFTFFQTDSCLQGNTAHHSPWRIPLAVVILFPHFSHLTGVFEHCKGILYTVILISSLTVFVAQSLFSVCSDFEKHFR